VGSFTPPPSWCLYRLRVYAMRETRTEKRQGFELPRLPKNTRNKYGHCIEKERRFIVYTNSGKPAKRVCNKVNKYPQGTLVKKKTVYTTKTTGIFWSVSSLVDRVERDRSDLCIFLFDRSRIILSFLRVRPRLPACPSREKTSHAEGRVRVRVMDEQICAKKEGKDRLFGDLDA